MTYSLPNQINNGDSIDATPVQGNFDSIENELNNIETTQTTDGTNITALKTAVEEGGWSLESTVPAYSIGLLDGPTQGFTIAGDLRARYHAGTRVKYNQNQAIQNYWSFDTNSADSKGSATMADIGTPTYTAGKFGNALTLNGTNQALSITSSASFTLTNNFSIGMWFKTSTAGTQKFLFQSYNEAANTKGLRLEIGTTNLLSFGIGSNAASASFLGGTTTVTDGAWHYVVISFRDNTVQMYLDGKLENSSYMPTPVYDATNYVRIGVRSNTGTSVAGTWFNGQIDDLFIAAYALDEQTIKAKYDAATAQGTGDITLTKYGLVTASSYSSPNTTVTIYSGTDHTMMNSTISNAYYSTQKAPYGFLLDPAKWTTQMSLLQVNGTTNASNYSNITGATMNVPIGKWQLYYSVLAAVGAGAGDIKLAVTLSSGNTTESWPRMTSGARLGAAISYLSSQFTKFDNFSFSSKTTVYLNLYSSSGALSYESGMALNPGSQSIPTIIRATSTLL